MTISSWQPTASLENLKKRAKIISQIRTFFNAHNVLEVDTPLLADYPNLDDNISPFSVQSTTKKYLVTSPEYYMKRLLVAYHRSFFQFCHCFRKNEQGQFHNSEFTMLEYYRINLGQWALMKELDELLQSILQTPSCSWLSYDQAFQNIGIVLPPLQNIQERQKVLFSFLKSKDDVISTQLTTNEDLEEYIFSFYIQPKLGKTNPVFITHYPITQGALAQICQVQKNIALRFELFYKAVELGNGYQELQDEKEQKNRMNKWNQNRVIQGKTSLPLDPNLEKAMQAGLPFCSGIALGIDRLILLATKETSLEKVQTFYYN